MNMTTQTAIEWLIDELNQKIDFIPMDKWDMIRDIIQKAIAMEKEQMIKAFNEGTFASDEKVTAEQYYNETYKS
jgi:hypothetical protein